MSEVFSALFVVAVFCLVFVKERNKRKKETEIKTLTKVTTEPRIFTDILDRAVENIFIAGLSHHCTMQDIGVFQGVVFPEKDKPHDKKAMAIGDNRKKKILGYVPSAILDDYRNWCGGESRGCVGFIYYDGDHLRGRVRVYPPFEEGDETSKLVNKDASKFAGLVADHFGWELNEDGSMK